MTLSYFSQFGECTLWFQYLLQNEYTKEKAEQLNKYSIPADTPSIVQAKIADKQLSDVSRCFTFLNQKIC